MERTLPSQDSGRQLIEEHLQHPVVVDRFPGGLAGTADPDIDSNAGYPGFKSRIPGIVNNSLNVFWPFGSRLEHDIAQWAKTRGVGSNAASDLLSIPGVQERLGLGFKNVRELNAIIDKQIPATRPRFKRAQVCVADEGHTMFYRDVIQCIESLFGDPEFAPYLVFAPERHYADKDRTIRLYHDMHTGKWWWETQVHIYDVFNYIDDLYLVSFRKNCKKNLQELLSSLLLLLLIRLKSLLLGVKQLTLSI